MRYVKTRDQMVLHALGSVPAVLPLALVVAVARRPSAQTLGVAMLPFVHNIGVFMDLNRRFLRHATPWQRMWMVPLQQIVFPLQLLVALLSPQRINWRGHLIAVERGGTLRITQRRTNATLAHDSHG